MQFLILQSLTHITTAKMKFRTSSANIIPSDFPDLDVIRVDDAYYMVSTTMHFMPGCVILRSYNLLDWEFCTYVFDELEATDGQTLKDNKGVYGRGMWAASLRFNNGKFYVSFVANDTHKTYLYTSDKIEGPYKKTEIPGFFHDMSVLFDDDGKVYVVSGNTEITLTQMESNLSAPKKGGINKVIIKDDKEKVNLGFEGCHFYKINGKYYVFMIHMPKGKMRTEACYFSDKIDGPYTGGDVLCSDFENWNSGIAQGGIVQSTDGKWYGILFQDHGALGRIPILVEVDFDESGFPIFTSTKEITCIDNRPDYKYEPLYADKFLKGNKLNSCWQFNHIPDKNLITITENKYSIKTDKIAKNITQAINTLTQRTFTEKCSGQITVDASQINEGDFAGLCALEGEYAFIAITKKENKFYLCLMNHKIPYTQWTMNVYDDEEAILIEEIEIKKPVLTLKAAFDLTKEKQTVLFSYSENNKNDFKTFGKENQLRYTLDQFVGVRFALFNFSTKQTGGKASFKDFYIEPNEKSTSTQQIKACC